MKITLKDGKEARVGCAHVIGAKGKRGTKVWFEKDQQLTAQTAWCSLEDNFSKKIGRKLAVGRLINHLRYQLEKEDRRLIFNSICPEYQSKAKR